LISVIIIAKNEEKNIEDCIRSVEWADEIVVVDGESTDNTQLLAKKFRNVNLIVNKFEGYTSQRRLALKSATHPWIFSIDADERATPELRDEIINTINQNKYDGLRIPRKSFFLDKWIKHCGWYPGYQMRLFRKNQVTVSERLVHEGYEVKGEIGFLKNDILHYTVTSIEDYMERVNRYSTLQALEKMRNKKVKFHDVFLRPPAAFFQHFFLKMGFLDGVHGLMVSYFDMVTNMLTYMKIYEFQTGKKKGE
jgi:glycosyltransferase involved in cell wall biosynthesis